MCVMFPCVTPDENDVAFRCHGKALDLTVKVSPSGPVQVENVSEVMEPIPVPDRPLPFFSEPLALEDLQDSVVPVAVSLRVVLPALAVMAPPGVTLKVVAVLAPAKLATLRPISAAVATPVRRMVPARLKIAIGPYSLIDFRSFRGDPVLRAVPAQPAPPTAMPALRAAVGASLPLRNER